MLSAARRGEARKGGDLVEAVLWRVNMWSKLFSLRLLLVLVLAWRGPGTF